MTFLNVLDKNITLFRADIMNTMSPLYSLVQICVLFLLSSASLLFFLNEVLFIALSVFFCAWIISIFCFVKHFPFAFSRSSVLGKCVTVEVELHRM